MWSEEDERKEEMNEELLVKVAFSTIVFALAITVAFMVSGCTPHLQDDLDGWRAVTTPAEKLRVIGPCSCMERPNQTIEGCYCEPPKKHYYTEDDVKTCFEGSGQSAAAACKKIAKHTRG